MRRTLLLFAALVAIHCSRPAGAVRDDLGRAIRMPREVRRIVTLAPNLTEIAFAIGAGPRVIATDDFSDTPAEARGLAKVGGVQPNAERIAAMHPDLVVALSSSNHPNLAAALDAAHVPLFVFRTDRLDDVPRAMERFGALIDAPGAAGAAASLRSAIARQKRGRAAPPRVLFVVWTDPLYVGGRETFADDLMALTGASNAVAVRGWPQYALESVVAAPPDLIVYPDRSVKQPQIDALLRRAPELRKSRIVAVDENLFTRPGPRVALAAASLNSILDSWEKSH